MIKKHLTHSMYMTYQRTSFKQLLKKTFELPKEIPILLKKTLELGTRESDWRNFCEFY